MRLKEIDVFIVMSLTFLFIYSIWGVDISVGAIGTGNTLINLSGYMNPYDLYHFSLQLLIATWIFSVGYWCIRFHYVRVWKNGQSGKH